MVPWWRPEPSKTDQANLCYFSIERAYLISSSLLSKVGKNYNNFPAYKIWMSQIEWEQDKIEMVIEIFYFFKDYFRTDLEDEK